MRTLKWLLIIIVIILVYCLFLSLQPVRFNIWYPTIQGYPDNNKEIKLVNEYIAKRTSNDIQFFKLTDPNPLNAFQHKISESQFRQLNKLVISPSVIMRIMYYKILYNRARPSQVAPDAIDYLDSETANTASYPSGHAFQAYYAAKILSQWEPARKQEWMDIAERVANIRIIAGLHYPSDRDFARQLVADL
jgi:membrane-associated phospholipid phosphatase